MEILLVNDDGIYASGILSLASALKQHHKVIIVAPHKQMSGTSHALTLHQHLNFQKLEIITGVESYVINGTPADCTKFGMQVILGHKPDFVVSGINNGHNLGTDVIYSGTVNASLEASILGVKSIAISQQINKNDYQFACDFIVQKLHTLYELLSCDNSAIFSINFPNCEDNEVKGAKFTTVGKRIYDDKYVFEEGKGYLITGQPKKSLQNLPTIDEVACSENYISISPIIVDYNAGNIFLKYKEINL